jgi:hypothetical protein
MTTNEIAAAVEWLRERSTFTVGGHDYEKMIQCWRILATAFIAERDETAVTKEWVMSLGVDHIDLVQRLKEMMDNGDPVDGDIRQCFKTRGDVLRLLRALQIPTTDAGAK